MQNKSGRDREVAEEHGEREGVQEGTARHLLPEVHGDEALGGSGTAFGKLPKEGKLETEDEVDESYKADESEEESGEELGEGSEE